MEHTHAQEGFSRELGNQDYTSQTGHGFRLQLSGRSGRPASPRAHDYIFPDPDGELLIARGRRTTDSPFRVHRKAHQAKTELLSYMESLRIGRFSKFGVQKTTPEREWAPDVAGKRGVEISSSQRSRR